MAVYLDYNASTPIDNRVATLMYGLYKETPGNAGSRTHNQGNVCRNLVEDARKQIASLCGVSKSEVFFTSGATESNNLAIAGLREYANCNNRKHIVTTTIEHEAVLQPVKMLEKEGFNVTYISPDENGVVSAKDVLGAIREDTALVTVMHVNNETGAIQPIIEIGEGIEKSHPKTLFHIDASQSFGKLVEEIRKAKYDMLSATAHKMYGPQGIGVLVAKKKRYKYPPIKPIVFGGGQEMGMRSGTIPVVLVAGFGYAAELCQEQYDADHRHCTNIKERALRAIDQSGVQYVVNGTKEGCVPSTLSISFTDVSSEALMIAARDVVSISNGSACSSESYEPSHVLLAAGYSRDRAESTVRLSWGRGSDKDEVIDALTKLAHIAKDFQ